MDLNNLYQNTKLASALGAPTAPATPTSSRGAVQAAIEAAAQEAHTKVASVQAGSPLLGDLRQAAEKVASSMQNATLKEGHDIGRAICDGFVAQLGAYEKAAADLSARAQQGATKEAQAEQEIVERTTRDVEQRIHKVASDHWLGGYAIVGELLT